MPPFEQDAAVGSVPRLHVAAVALLRLVCAGALGLTVAVLLLDVQVVRLGVADVSVRNPARSFFVGIVAAALLAYLRPGTTGRLGVHAAHLMRHVPGWLPVAVVAAGVLVAAVRYGSFVAAAADSYGYITQAEMLSAGRLVRPESTLASTATWPEARRSLAPLGWRPATHHGLVPIYPPGYPLLMAAAATLRPTAMALVVPVAGVLTIVALGAIARRAGDRSLGVAGAVLLATNPVFLLFLMVPMSDVVATAAWTSAVALALSPGPLAAAAGGAAAGVALLVRPNLVPLVAGFAVIVFAATRGPTGAAVARSALAGIGVTLGALGVGWFQWQYYGTPFQSGYGALTDLFAFAHAPVNITQFTEWLTSTHPTYLLAAAAVGLWRSAVRATGLPRSCVLFAALVPACYLLYLPFGDWSYLRFLLPAFPLAMLLAADGMRHVTRRLNDDVRPVVLVGGVVWCALLQVHEARVRHVFVNADSVARFERISRDLGATLPPSAIVITREFSGSLQYYGGVQTLRWDWLDEASLGIAARHIEASGRALFVLLDARDEAPAFRDRLGDQPLPWEVVRSFEGSAERLTLYRVLPLGRHIPDP